MAERGGGGKPSLGDGRMQTRSRDQLAEMRPRGITCRSEPVRLQEPGRGEWVEAGLAGGGKREREAKEEQGEGG